MRDAVAAAIPRDQPRDRAPAADRGRAGRRARPKLFGRNPDLCCSLRKVLPLERGAGRLRRLGPGLRRDESPPGRDTRSSTGTPQRQGQGQPAGRAGPRTDVDAYIERARDPGQPAAASGYASVGCCPCTRRSPPARTPAAAAGPAPPRPSAASTWSRRHDVAQLPARSSTWPAGAPSSSAAARSRRGARRRWSRPVRVVHVVAPWVCEDLAATSSASRSSPGWRATTPAATSTAPGSCTPRPATRAPTTWSPPHAEGARVWCVRADDATLSARLDAGRGPGRRRDRRGDRRRRPAPRDDAARRGRARPATRGDLPLRRHRAATAGHVALVGGGPGDPGLITARGRAAARRGRRRRRGPARAARAARRARPRTSRSSTRARPPQAHPLPQEEINALLVEHAGAGRRVVRLKGGDPFVLGRGGEEALACLAAGVPVEVVPGVTSAVAVPARRRHPGHPPRRRPPVHHRLGARRGARLGLARRARGHPRAADGRRPAARSSAPTPRRGRRDPATPVALIRSGASPRRRSPSGRWPTSSPEHSRPGLPWSPWWASRACWASGSAAARERTRNPGRAG